MNENTDNLSGRWSWFQCFISYYNREFYLNENTQTLITETLYREGNTEFKNDEPLGRFFNDIKSQELSYLELKLTKNKNSKIYMRSFYLFKDYLPYNYNFKYMDMTQIGTGQFPPLTFAVNFAHYNFRTSILKYKKYTSLDNIAKTIEKTLVYPLNKNTQLCSNFDFLPLCDPTTKEKYNPETKLCQEITLCDPTELNAVYCMEERTPLICKKNYYINIDSSDGTVTCENYCKDKENYFRVLNEGKKSNEQKNYDEIIRRALKTGTFEYGDQFYRLEMIEKIISLAKHKGHLDQIPKIFIEIEKAIEESKKEKK
jgi:hypothetical protein